MDEDASVTSLNKKDHALGIAEQSENVIGISNVRFSFANLIL